MKFPFMTAARAYPDHLRPLTSLRFIAAFWVMLFHFVTVLPHGAMRDWVVITKGYLGVDFFFILSGFILYHVYRHSIETGVISLKGFYVRRLARIYPMHIFTLLLYIAGLLLAFHMVQDESARRYLQQYEWQFNWHTITNNILLLHGWGFEHNISFNKPSWSISSEWFAYLLFPFLVPAASRITPGILLLVAGLFLAAMWFAVPYLVHSDMTQLACNYSVLRILPEFVFGMALNAVGTSYALNIPARPLFVVNFCAIIAACLFHGPDIVIVFMFGALIFISAESERQEHPGFLGRRFPVRLGELSFAIYMTHFPVMDGLYIFVVVLIYRNRMPVDIYLLTWLMMFALTFVLAAILNHILEHPVRKWLDDRAGI